MDECRISMPEADALNVWRREEGGVCPCPASGGGWALGGILSGREGARSVQVFGVGVGRAPLPWLGERVGGGLAHVCCRKRPVML